MGPFYSLTPVHNRKAKFTAKSDWRSKYQLFGLINGWKLMI